MISTLIPSVYRMARSETKTLGKIEIELLSVCSVLGTFKPMTIINKMPCFHYANVYGHLYRLRDAGYIVLSRKGTEQGFRRVSGLYRITPKGRKFMEDFVKEMEAIAERLEHGY